ncbi:hypothetical protein [Prauserella endophytica]|uniref:Uncharacterized protein n=1 Tax=Prauserella endophytica TaxID=1592324 RepID=A0ABY2RUV3_9PSEU|nr:hypothetical protein [Prauserella endophytica]TKG61519.1 hypothetical protein FCN18_33305 [Prauserella endophytica]
MELDDVGREVTQRAAQLASVALNLAQQLHARRDATARQEQQIHQGQRDEITQRLQADRAAHAGLWNTLRHNPRTPLDDATLAEQWVTAAAWEPHDTRAAAARAALEDRLVHAGIDRGELDRIRTEKTFTGAADTLTAHLSEHRANHTGQEKTTGLMLTEAAQERTDAAQHRATAAAADTRASTTEQTTDGEVDHDGTAEQAHHEHTADTERTLAAAHDSDATATEANTDVPDPAGNVYAHGAPSARLAGESYPEPAATAVTRTRSRAQPRKASPPRERDHGRGR